MGAYVNPSDQSKEEWLEENADKITKQEAKEISENIKYSEEMAVCLVDNGPFTAAGICFEEREFEAFSRADDPRPKLWFRAKTEDLLKVSDELEKYMEHSNVS
jgi:hypothetical protein